MKSQIFVVDPAPTFTGTVKGFKPGLSVNDDLPVEFNWMSEEDYNAMVLDALENKRTGPEVVMRILNGWGNEQIQMPLPFSRESVDQMARLYPKFCNAVISAYRAEVKDAQAKN